MRLFWISQLLLFQIVTAFKPKIHKSELPGPANNLVYFNDSSVILYHTIDGIYRSDNDGASWDKVTLDGSPQLLIEHPFDKDRAYAITSGSKHYATRDRGESWYSFETSAFELANPISFHAEKPDHVLFAGMKDGKPVYYYSVKGFENGVKELFGARQCQFARSSVDFKGGELDSIVCADHDGNLVESDNFYKSKTDLKLKVVGFGGAGKFFVAAVEKARDLVDLYVTTDFKNWNKADFGDDEIPNSYTVLESSDHSLHIDVVIGGRGSFYTSDSTGTHFTKSLENTHRNMFGMVDIEKVEGVDGVLIANIDEHGIQSRISFDDGRTWNSLKADGKDLHLHSVTDHQNVGRIFSSPAPGVIAGIGNTGHSLRSYEHGDMYISHDNGLTWKNSHEHAQLYEFGDQGNVMMAAYNGKSDRAFYSLDRGETWERIDIDTVRPRFLFTTPDSTSLKFVLLGESKGQYVSMAFDFTNVYDKQCKKDDFEKWYARYDAKGEPSCIMGHKQFYWRKKASSKCIVGSLYHEPVASEEVCECDVQDFECEAGFKRRGDRCVDPNLECASGETVERPSGLRKIPGNNCKGAPPKTVKEECMAAADKGISHKEFPVKGKVFDYFYLRSEDKDETIVLRTDRHEVFLTHDHGSTWKRVLKHEAVIGMYPHPAKSDIIYFVTANLKLHVSRNRGEDFKEYDLPARPSQEVPSLFSFHEKKPDWILFHGEKGCDNPFSLHCQTTTYYTLDGGESWKELTQNSRQCSFAPQKEQLVMCEKHGKEGVKLVSSNNWFKDVKSHFDNIVGFAVEYEFIVVAAIDKHEKESLKAFVSVDGENFSAADFPHNFKVNKQQAYTVLESKTKAVFLHVTVNGKAGTEYGSLLKSNSNGTEYVISAEGVNRNEFGFVDFEKMEGLEGVAMINTVSNTKEANNGMRKKLKTKITYNDGGEWVYLKPPQVDSEKKSFSCSGGLEDCSLNLHGFTEREDYRDTFSSQSAVGLMIGVGNVGPELTPIQEANTFMTRDGGNNWREVVKGSYMWEFGDSGSIVVLVSHKDPTNKVMYSLDEGLTWKEYEFSKDMIRVESLATIPSDMSRKFMLVGRPPASKGDKSLAIQLDFTGLTDKQCVLDEENPEKGDFDLWTPSHPDGENCLFGHEALYHRKKVDRDCYVGRSIDTPHRILRNCSCTRQDFECDFNYILAKDGTCELMPGYSPPDHSKACSEMSDKFEYWEPTGYRRVPLSTCKGGKELDKVVSHPCPGKEKEYEERHRGLHGFALFVVIVLPIGMTAVIAVIIWDHYSKRYGQIRLGEENDDQPLLIQYLAVAVAGVVAVVGVVPAVVSSIYTHVKQRMHRPRFDTRRSFARSYAPVENDESELLHSDDDLEIHSDDES